MGDDDNLNSGLLAQSLVPWQGTLFFSSQVQELYLRCFLSYLGLRDCPQLSLKPTISVDHPSSVSPGM